MRTSVKERIKQSIRRVPFVYHAVNKLYLNILAKQFSGSEKFWIDRYAVGGNSGAGSFGQLAEFKAEILNNFASEHKITSVIEYGCGDGNQLQLANYQNYLGFDVSPVALSLCKAKFSSDPSKTFKLAKDYNGERADLTLSLDVIYHLVEDSVFESYMEILFSSSDRFVIIYSSNHDEQIDLHVNHREFTKWISKSLNGWKLLQHIPNRYPYRDDLNKGSIADFYIYAKAD